MRPRLILIFDVCCVGLMRRYRRRLELLGYRCLRSPYKYDHQIMMYRRELERRHGVPAVVVTYDKDFGEGAVVLTQDRRYEEQVTELLKKLARGEAGGHVTCTGACHAGPGYPDPGYLARIPRPRRGWWRVWDEREVVGDEATSSVSSARLLCAVYRLVKARGAGVSVAEICRLLNRKTLDDCLHIRCKYYLNPRRRAKLAAREPPCRINYAQVRRAVKWLEEHGLIYCYRERRPDHREPRGYDYFKVCYPQPKPPLLLSYLEGVRA